MSNIYNIIYIIGYSTRIGQYVALLKAIVNIFNSLLIGLIQAILVALLLYFARQVALAQTLPPGMRNPFLSGEMFGNVFAVINPLATILLLLWVF